MKSLKGYVFSREIGENLIPQKIQNIVLRDYSNKKKYNFIMSSVEYSINNSFIILNKLIKNLDKYDGILAYSIFQMPNNQNKRVKLYEQIISKKKEFHFALEDIVISKSDIQNLNFIEETISIKKAVKKNTINLKKFKNYT
jgi:sporadic carbohydrate cluster protein (TIGR04323 family)